MPKRKLSVAEKAQRKAERKLKKLEVEVAAIEKAKIEALADEKARKEMLEKQSNPMSQRSDETDQGYEGFLLYCMCDPSKRNSKLIAKATGYAASSLRYWRRKFKWDLRCAQTSSPEYVALKLYRERMTEYVGKPHADKLRAAMDIVNEVAGFAELRQDIRRQRTSQPSRLNGASEAQVPHIEGRSAPSVTKSHLVENEIESIDPARYMQDLAATIRTNHLRPQDVKRQVVLIDAVLGLIAKKVQSGELNVTVKDIPSLLRARALLTGLPTEQVAVAVHQKVDTTVTHMVESNRMQDARKVGNETAIVSAMKDEVEELRVILGAIPEPITIEATLSEPIEAEVLEQ